MEGRYVLFDTDCPDCSKVAGKLAALGVDDLAVKSLKDKEVVELFARVGRELPHKPALIQVSGDTLAVWTGIPMRIRLARMLGARRAGEIVELAGMEAKAHLANRPAVKGRLSRRRLLSGTATGAGAVALGMALPAAAHASPPPPASLSADAKRRLLMSPAMQRASHVWGAPDETSILAAVAPSGENVAMVPHLGDHRAFSFISVDRADEPLGITITPSASGEGIRYYLNSGTPLAEAMVLDGELEVSPLDASAAPPAAEPEPEGTREFVGCFVGCMGANLTPECALACFRCVFGTVFEKPLACPVCALCAGPKGLECARLCRNFL